MFSQISLAFALVAAVTAPPAAELPAVAFTVPFCKLEFKREVRSAYFAATVNYRLITGATGLVQSVEEDSSSPSAPPFRPVFESLERCLKSWTLEPNTEYLARLTWGSSELKRSWRVCRTSGGCLDLSERPQ